MKKIFFIALLIFLPPFWGWGGVNTSYAAHNINATMKYKLLDADYEVKVTTIETFTSNYASLTGTEVKNSSHDCVFKDPKLTISGAWIVEIENNSDIDFAIKYPDKDYVRIVPAHSTKQLILRSYTNFTKDFLTYSTHVDKWTSLNGFNFYYLFNYYYNTEQAFILYYSLNYKMDDTCKIVGEKYSFGYNYHGSSTEPISGETITFKGTIKKFDPAKNKEFIEYVKNKYGDI